MINPALGLSAFTEGKYLKRNNDILIVWLKNFVQIFIPIASLTITILVLSLESRSINKFQDKEIKELNSRIRDLEDQINKELYQKNDSSNSKL